MRTRIWASIVVVAFVVPLLAAQVDFGAINGVVTDSSGAVLPGVTIELTGPERRTVLTGGRGEFSVVRLRPGEYDVLIPSPDSARFVQRSLSLPAEPRDSRFRCAWGRSRKR